MGSQRQSGIEKSPDCEAAAPPRSGDGANGADAGGGGAG